MRRIFFWCFVTLGLAVAMPAQAATGRVIKMLPFFLDLQGRHALSPSLYERDAYQAYLREHPDKRSAMLFDVQWKVKGPPWGPLKIRVELRGSAQGNVPTEAVLEKSVELRGHFSHWTGLTLQGTDYTNLGELTAWRATLWEGDELLGEQKSFLW
jgi:hypothetical protein